MQASNIAPHGSGFTAIARGGGPTVVVIHGALGDYRQWNHVGDVLVADHRVVAMSRRHHWPNAPPIGSVRYSYETHSDDLQTLLESIGRPVHVVGHSYGAGVALVTALRGVPLIRSLVLIEPALVSVLPRGDRLLEAELASRHEMAAAVRDFASTAQDREAAVAMIDWVQGGPGGFNQLPQWARDGLLENAATIGPTFAGAQPDVTCDELRGVRLPVFVLPGEHTRLYFRRIAEAVASCVPGAAIASVPTCAHMSIVESPKETAALIAQFLAHH